MARYIDADDVAQRLMYYMSHTPERCGEHYAYKAALKEVVGSPTADVEEVKHGKWIPVQYTYFGLKRYECSECKDDEYWQKRYIEHKEKYCPNCGAKMDGGNAE